MCCENQARIYDLTGSLDKSSDQIHDLNESLDKMKRLDLWSQRILDQDLWDQIRGGGHWAMTSPLGAEGALRSFGALQSRMYF